MEELNQLIGDGKGMKKTLSFKFEEKYCIYENDELLFTIDQNQLKLDSKILYEKVFKGIKDTPEIIMENNVDVTDDKDFNNLSSLIYKTLSSLIEDICLEIQNQKIFTDGIIDK